MDDTNVVNAAWALPVIRAVTKWRHLLCRLKCTHWCDHVLSYLSITSVTKAAPTYHVVWFCNTALNHGGNQRDGRRIAKRPTTDAAKDRETSRTSIALLSFVSTVMNIFARGILVIENSFLQILQKARQMMQINCDLEFFWIFCIGCLGCCDVNMYYISIWW